MTSLFAFNAHAQWKFPDLTTGGPFYHTDKVCNYADKHFHDVTYVYYKFLGLEGPYTFFKDMQSQPPELCYCIAMGGGGGGSAIRGLKPHASEDECHSPGTQGQQGTYDNSSSPVSGDWSSSSSPDLRAHASGSAAGAFSYTVPFRALPLGPTSSGAPQSALPGCNSQGNPAMYGIEHVSAVVNRYDLCTGATTASVSVAPFPLQVRVTPDGSQAIVTNYGNAITFIDTATNKILASMQTDPNFTPSGLAIAPDGTYALVTNYEPPPDAFLAVVDIASRTITRKIPLDTEFPQSVRITPDGLLAWVTYPWDNRVEVIDILTGAVIRALSFSTPYSVAFNPTGTVAFVAGGENAGSVAAYETKTYTKVATIPAGAGACDLRLSLDGSFLFTNDAFGSSVTIIDTRALTGVTQPTQGESRGAVTVPTQ